MKIAVGYVSRFALLIIQSAFIVLLVYFLIISISRPVQDESELMVSDLFKPEAPAFYFSVLPGYYDLRLVNMTISPVKTQAINLMGRGWTYEEWVKLHSLITLLEASGGNLSQLQSMRYASTVGQLMHLYNEYDYIDVEAATGIYLKTLRTLIYKDRSLPFTGYVPTLHWWGVNNQFHQMWHQFTSNVRERNTIGEAFGWSFILAMITFFLVNLFGTLWAIWWMQQKIAWQNNVRNKKWVLNSVTFGTNLVYIMPVFGLATLLIPIFTTDDISPLFHWFPGVGSFLLQGGNGPFNFSSFYYLFFPALLMSLPLSAGLAIRWHAGMEKEWHKPFVQSLVARGFSSKQILFGHILRIVALPMTIYAAMLLPALIAGTLIIENIFAIPGLGRLTFQSIQRQDIFTIIVITWIVALICLVSNFVAGILSPIIDPRLRITRAELNSNQASV